MCDVSQQADRLSNASVPVCAAQPHTDRESQTAATALPSPSQEAEILFLKYYSALTVRLVIYNDVRLIITAAFIK